MPDSPSPDGPHQQESASATGIQSLAVPQRAPRSCQLCHTRKVRCDKKNPCTPCCKAGKPCVYPPPGPRYRRSKRTINAEMASRIAHLEKTLGKVASAKADSTSDSPSPSRKRASVADQLATPSHSISASELELSHPHWRQTPGDVLVQQQDSSSQYFNDIVLSRVLHEEQGVQSELVKPLRQPAPLKGPSPFNPSGLFSTPDPSTPPHLFHPSREVATQLWRHYVEVIENCLTVRLLHIPTDEVQVFTTIQDPQNASFDDLALAFAIYFTSCVAMEDSVAESILQQGRVQGILNLKRGLEQCMAHLDFLDAPTYFTVKALAIYMAGLRIRNRGKSIWMINGLALRAARSLGFHTDGERLGLSPFKAEIRRRIWWFLVLMDGRANEDYGLPGMADSSPLTNVSLPLNVEDIDLHWDMKELPQPRAEWTDMSPSLIHIESFLAVQRLSIVASSSDPSEEARLRIINEARAVTNRYLKRAKPVVPRQRLMLMVSEFILRKLDFVSRLQWKLLNNSDFRELFASDEFLIEASELLEKNKELAEDELLKPYSIPSKAYQQNSLMLYALWHLCVRPVGPHSQRAWDLICRRLDADQEFKAEGLSPKMVVIHALARRVKQLREQYFAETRPVQTASVPSDGSGSVSAYQPPPPEMNTGTDPYNWEFPTTSNGQIPGFDIPSMPQMDWMAFMPRVEEGEGVENVFWGY